jgi:pimeloyl-ACP methyl ester carboxylesterase
MPDVTFRSGDVVLAGSLWLPETRLVSGVVMVGGSGDADRDNDVLFPPIREHLLLNGIAVLSYDKRGVGRSTGSWRSSTLFDLADDAESALELLLAETRLGSAGVFGHSQGGWVVSIVASRQPRVAWMITNSGPGVSPRRLALYEQSKTGRTPVFGELPAEGFLDFEPEPVLERVRCPALAIFGKRDALVPVDESVAVFRRALPSSQLSIRVLAGADHRLKREDGTFVEGYPRMLTEWITALRY